MNTKRTEALKLALEAQIHKAGMNPVMQGECYLMHPEALQKLIEVATREALVEQPAQQRIEELLDIFKDVDQCGPLLGMGQPAQQQEPVERGVLRFYTNGIERQHWKADGSIDFKDEQGNVTMTLASGEIEAPIGFYAPPASKPLVWLTDEEAIFLIENESLGRGELIDAIKAKLREKNHG